jgi:molecular chaperone GrpE
MKKNTSKNTEKNNITEENTVKEDTNKKQENNTTAETTETNNTDINIEELQQELADAQTSTKENYDKLVRMQAEMENLRKRNTKDLENAHKFALDGFAKSLLEVADSIAMGIKTAGDENATTQSIKEGMELTNKIFLDALEKNSITQINPKTGNEGDAFNPETHEAITMVPSEEVESGKIIDVVQVGFALNDRVIRPAMVVVAS